jgi:transcriptional regulator with XRE-family HTH domain
MGFGDYVKHLRLEQKTTLRQFCSDHQLDPSNWSKVERGILPAPKDIQTLELWAKYFGLRQKTEEWIRFMDGARISRGEIPQDLLKNQATLSLLPVFFSAFRGTAIDVGEVEKLIEKIREANRISQSRPRLKAIVEKTRLGAGSERSDLTYWLSRPPAERVEAVELLRKEHYGSSNRLQRHVRVIKPT